MAIPLVLQRYLYVYITIYLILIKKTQCYTKSDNWNTYNISETNTLKMDQYAPILWETSGSSVFTEDYISLSNSYNDTSYGFVINTYAITEDEIIVNTRLNITTNSNSNQGNGMSIQFIPFTSWNAIRYEEKQSLFGLIDVVRGFSIILDTRGINKPNKIQLYTITNKYFNKYNKETNTTKKIEYIKDNIAGDSIHQYYPFTCYIKSHIAPYINIWIWIRNNELRLYTSSHSDASKRELCFGIYIPPESLHSNKTVQGYHIAFTSQSIKDGHNFYIQQVKTILPNPSVNSILKSQSINDINTTTYNSSLPIISIAIVIINFFLSIYYISEYNTYLGMIQSKINYQAIYDIFNSNIKIHFIFHLISTIFSLFYISTIIFILNLPLLIIRTIQLFTNTLLISIDTATTMSSRGKNLYKSSTIPFLHYILTLSLEGRYIFSNITYLISFFYSFWCTLS